MCRNIPGTRAVFAANSDLYIEPNGYNKQQTFLIGLIPLSHQDGVCSATVLRPKKLENAEHNAVESPRTTCSCSEDAQGRLRVSMVAGEFFRTPSDGVCFGYAQNKRRGVEYLGVLARTT